MLRTLLIYVVAGWMVTSCDKATSTTKYDKKPPAVERMENIATDIRRIDAAVAPRTADIDMSSSSNERPVYELSIPLPNPTIDSIVATLKARASTATRIAIVRTTASQVYPKILQPSDDPSAIVKTVTDIQAIELIQGNATPSSIEYRGGQIGDMTVLAYHQPTIEVGHIYLMFFEGNQAYEAYDLNQSLQYTSNDIVVPAAVLREALR